MRLLPPLLGLLAFAAPAAEPAAGGLLIPPRAKVLFIGDSVTDYGRKKPIGEGLNNVMGQGYVHMVNGLINATYPDAPIRTVNMGISGDTVRKLKARWQTDVLDLQPDWVSIMIGINDVWRQFDMDLFPEEAVLPAEYEATLDELVATTRPRVRGMTLMTPFFIEPSRQDPMRVRMDEYGAIVKRIGARHGVTVVDTQAAFDRYLAHRHSSTLCWDRVHPNGIGDLILTRAFLQAVGYDWHRDAPAPGGQ